MTRPHQKSTDSLRKSEAMNASAGRNRRSFAGTPLRAHAMGGQAFIVGVVDDVEFHRHERRVGHSMVWPQLDATLFIVGSFPDGRSADSRSCGGQRSVLRNLRRC